MLMLCDLVIQDDMILGPFPMTGNGVTGKGGGDRSFVRLAEPMLMVNVEETP
jgi:hypothetical protein